MTRMLKICSQCGEEHYFEDFSPSNCKVCNAPLPERSYSIELLDQLTELVMKIRENINCSFDEAVDKAVCLIKEVLTNSAKPTVSQNLLKPLKEPVVSENLLNDSSLWKILQSPE